MIFGATHGLFVVFTLRSRPFVTRWTNLADAGHPSIVRRSSCGDPWGEVRSLNEGGPIFVWEKWRKHTLL